jgi:surface antigen
MRLVTTRKLITPLIAVALVLPLSGCLTNESSGNLLGGVGGALAGNRIGSMVGGQNARIIGTVVGAAAGAMVGGAIGRRLDERDRLLAERSTRQALDEPSGRVIAWESQTNRGVNGLSQVVDRGRSSSGSECRRVRQVAYIRGEEVVEFQNFCRQASGQWAVA